MILVTYSHNNSGGNDWMSAKDWQKLEEHGWAIDYFMHGGKAYQAQKPFNNLKEGINEWRKLTGKNHRVEGCSCCGPPHNFYEEWKDDDA